MRKLMLTVLTLSCMYAAGCSTYAASRYSISPDNVVLLRQYQDSVIAVGGFSSTQTGLSELPCRMVGPIQTPDKTTFAEYIRQAFVGELQIAEVYDETSDIVLFGNLDKISFSSTSGKWEIAFTLTSSNSKTLSVEIVYDYSTSFFGETACNQTAQALLPAVQELIKALVTHDDFPALLETES